MDLGFLGGFTFLDKYFAEYPFDIIWANELNPSACATYKMNLGDHIVNDDIANAIASMPKEANAIIGGFPCQDISINGKMLGINGARSGLYSYMVEAVKRVSPEIFVAENVGGLLLTQNSYSLNKILDDFGALGYKTNFQLYKAELYGVPQTRERVFIVGVKKGLPEFIPPTPAHSTPISAKKALADLEDREKDKKIAHIWSMAKAKQRARQSSSNSRSPRLHYTGGMSWEYPVSLLASAQNIDARSREVAILPRFVRFSRRFERNGTTDRKRRAAGLGLEYRAIGQECVGGWRLS